VITLRGITWDHSRGYTPLVAVSEAWHDLNPEIEIRWTKRSLWGFGEGPLDEVARDYDLIVFDHPHTGSAAQRRLLLPLDELAPLVGACVGPSRESYEWGGHLYGLPIDAACQTAAGRIDLFESCGEIVPGSWDEVISLAARTGRVACSFSPMGSLGMLHSLAAGLGGPAGEGSEHYFPRERGLEALDRLQALFRACGPASLEHSPVRILGEMASADRILYAPLLYCYSNYARRGFAHKVIQFTRPLIHPEGAGATLGGAGLGISAFTQHREAAFNFARWLISEPCQSGPYLAAQGQPALRSIWTAEAPNDITHGFFRDLLPVIDRAFLRPNRPGYGEFQSAAGQIVRHFLLDRQTASETLHLIDRAYLESS
jgi:multiple sugar transport system substrate-binding protein